VHEALGWVVTNTGFGTDELGSDVGFILSILAIFLSETPKCDATMPASVFAPAAHNMMQKHVTVFLKASTAAPLHRPQCCDVVHLAVDEPRNPAASNALALRRLAERHHPNRSTSLVRHKNYKSLHPPLLLSPQSSRPLPSENAPPTLQPWFVADEVLVRVER
jgi:hypothetical protein